MKNAKDEIKPHSMSDSFNLILMVIGAHRLCILPFIRRDFGPEAFGIPGLMAAGFILAYGSLARAPAMMNFLWVWLAFLLMQRIRTAVKLRRGWVVHSRYQGTPWLAMKFVKNEKRAKGFEVLICLAAGVALMPVSEQVGGFVMLGGLSLLFYMGIENSLIRARTRRMRDAMIEQQFIAEQFRGQ